MGESVELSRRLPASHGSSNRRPAIDSHHGATAPCSSSVSRTPIACEESKRAETCSQHCTRLARTKPDTCSGCSRAASQPGWMLCKQTTKQQADDERIAGAAAGQTAAFIRQAQRASASSAVAPAAHRCVAQLRHRPAAARVGGQRGPRVRRCWPRSLWRAARFGRVALGAEFGAACGFQKRDEAAKPRFPCRRSSLAAGICCLAAADDCKR